VGREGASESTSTTAPGRETVGGKLAIAIFKMSGGTWQDRRARVSRVGVLIFLERLGLGQFLLSAQQGYSCMKA